MINWVIIDWRHWILIKKHPFSSAIFFVRYILCLSVLLKGMDNKINPSYVHIKCLLATQLSTVHHYTYIICTGYECMWIFLRHAMAFLKDSIWKKKLCQHYFLACINAYYMSMQHKRYKNIHTKNTTLNNI